MAQDTLITQGPDRTFDTMDSGCFENNKDGFFNNNFYPSVNGEQWQDWMKWDGSAIDFQRIELNRMQDTSSTISSYDISPDLENMGRQEASAAFVRLDEFPFEDGHFELEQIPQGVEMTGQNYPVLSEAEIRALQDIAMPYRILSGTGNSEKITPLVMESSVSPSPSPEPEVRTRKNNKRKSTNGEELPIELCQSRKRGHNAIEKRYRTNLNEKINCLRDGVPALCLPDLKSGDEIDDDSEGDVDGKAAQQKYGKAAILTRALEYIKHLENTTQRLGGDVESLKLRVGAFEKLAMSGNIIAKSGPLPSSEHVVVKSETLESIQAGMASSIIRQRFRC